MFGPTTSDAGGGDGFFSSIASSVGEGISRIGSDILPVWAANQLGVQQNDQLSQNTFTPDPNQPRNADAIRSTAGTVASANQAPATVSSVLNPTVLIVIGTFIVVGALLLRGR